MPIKIDTRPINLKIQLLLSVQRGLLDEVAPNLRSVQIDWNEENETIFLYFYFDGEITPDNFHSASCVAGEVAGDFQPSVTVVEKCIRMDFPKETPFYKLVAYRRKELDID